MIKKSNLEKNKNLQVKTYKQTMWSMIKKIIKSNSDWKIDQYDMKQLYKLLELYGPQIDNKIIEQYKIDRKNKVDIDIYNDLNDIEDSKIFD